jgi:hypothetical protein
MRVRFQELFAYEATSEAEDGYLLDGDLLDLEPAVRDALVLELPLSPLCDESCPGLCSRCGVRLAEAGPGHAHPDEDGVWAVLKDLAAELAGTGARESTGAREGSVPDGSPVPEGTPDGTPVPERAKEP